MNTRPLETNPRNLPFAYRLAIEWMGAQDHNRNDARLDALIEHCTRTAGTLDLTTKEEEFFRDSARLICSRSFYNWNQQ